MFNNIDKNEIDSLQSQVKELRELVADYAGALKGLCKKLGYKVIRNEEEYSKWAVEKVK